MVKTFLKLALVGYGTALIYPIEAGGGDFLLLDSSLLLLDTILLLLNK